MELCQPGVARDQGEAKRASRGRVGGRSLPPLRNRSVQPSQLPQPGFARAASHAPLLQPREVCKEQSLPPLPRPAVSAPVIVWREPPSLHSVPPDVALLDKAIVPVGVVESRHRSRSQRSLSQRLKPLEAPPKAGPAQPGASHSQPPNPIACGTAARKRSLGKRLEPLEAPAKKAEALVDANTGQMGCALAVSTDTSQTSRRRSGSRKSFPESSVVATDQDLELAMGRRSSRGRQHSREIQLDTELQSGLDNHRDFLQAVQVGTVNEGAQPAHVLSLPRLPKFGCNVPPIVASQQLVTKMSREPEHGPDASEVIDPFAKCSIKKGDMEVASTVASSDDVESSVQHVSMVPVPQDSASRVVTDEDSNQCVNKAAEGDADSVASSQVEIQSCLREAATEQSPAPPCARELVSKEEELRAPASCAKNEAQAACEFTALRSSEPASTLFHDEDGKQRFTTSVAEATHELATSQAPAHAFMQVQHDLDPLHEKRPVSLPSSADVDVRPASASISTAPRDFQSSFPTVLTQSAEVSNEAATTEVPVESVIQGEAERKNPPLSGAHAPPAMCEAELTAPVSSDRVAVLPPNTDPATAVSRSDAQQVIVGGTLFDVVVPNLRISMNPSSLLARAVAEARERDDDRPVCIEGDPSLFPIILDLHRNIGSCRIPASVSKAAVMKEARAFGLFVSAESIVQEGDAFRDGCLTNGASSITMKYYAAWSIDQVADWLKHVQQARFALYAETLRSQNIDGSALAAMTQEKMKAVGISDPNTRRALLAAIEAEAASTEPPCTQHDSEVKKTSNEEEQEDDDELIVDKRLDAAALILRSMFGEIGTPKQFTEMIAAWRAEHSLTKPGADGKLADEVLGQVPVDKAVARATKGILVAARVRPLLKDGPDRSALDVGDFESVSKDADCVGMVVHSCGVQRDGRTPKMDNKAYRVHMALDSSCSEERVFNLASPVVDNAVRNCLHASVLCYGQTGSGKTHTVGNMAVRLARHLYNVHHANIVVLEAFELKGGAKGLVSSTSNVFSLNSESKPELPLFEGEDGSVHVGGSNSVVACSGQQMNLTNCSLASSTEELESIFRQAESRRTSHDTARNAASSRSHAFYRFYLASQTDASSSAQVISTGACIELVDLAGSESNKDSLYHNKTQIDERAKINSSLTALNTCIQKTIQGASYVPFRADKLTQILRPCFARRDGTSAAFPTVVFLACLSPLASDAQQSIRTLTYTQELAGLKGKAQLNAQQKKFMGPGLKRLAAAAEKGDIEELRAAITFAQNNGITGPQRRRAAEVLRALEEQGPPEEAASSTNSS